MRKKKREFMALYQPVHEQFERFCKARAYGSMDFKDLMHDTLLLAFEKFELIDNKHAFLSYLIGSSVKILANANRKIQEQKWDPDELSNTQAYHRTDESLEVEDLYKAIAQLSGILSEAIVLFEISGFSIKEIAQIQNASEAAVKQRLSRARSELATLLKDEPALDQTAEKMLHKTSA